MGKITNEEILKERYQDIDVLMSEISEIEDEISDLKNKREKRIFTINDLQEEIRKLKENITYVK